MITKRTTHLGFLYEGARLCELYSDDLPDILAQMAPHLAQQLCPPPGTPPVHYCRECAEVFFMFGFPETVH